MNHEGRITVTPDMLEGMTPILNDAHKKTPPGPRTEQLEKILTIVNINVLF